MTSPQSVSLPLYSPLSTRSESVLKDSRLINGFAEKEQGATGQETWIYKRPGLKASTAVTPGAGLGVFNWNNDIFTIFGTILYKNGVSKGSVNARFCVPGW